jgi:hypothetical protein
MAFSVYKEFINTKPDKSLKLRVKGKGKDIPVTGHGGP